MLVKSVRTVSREFCLEKRLHWAYVIWLAEGVSKIRCCAKLVFMPFIIRL